MGKQLHRDDALIRAITPKIVRAAFNLSYQSLRNWRLRGIPETVRPEFANLALRHGAVVPSDFLKPRDQRAENAVDIERAAA
ncbi:hypothetical protein ABIC65_001059 [Sphingomonas trueperi]